MTDTPDDRDVDPEPDDDVAADADDGVAADLDDGEADADDSEGAEPDDAGDGDGGAGTAARRVHPAVYARNWRTVLAVDAAMGLVVVVAGVIVAVAWNLVAGGLLGSLGIAYVFAVVRRGREWAELRREAGL